MSDGPHRVFIYGTLRRNQCAAALMRGACYLGTCLSSAPFILYDLGDYPAAVAGGKLRIVGEVYAVNTPLLARLDAFERVPELYQRARTDTGYGTAWLYLMPTPPRGAPVVTGGDWVVWHQG